jgi:hypothetical protein
MTAHRSDREKAEDALRARASLAGETFDHETLEAPGSVVGYPSASLLEGADELSDDLADDDETSGTSA